MRCPPCYVGLLEGNPWCWCSPWFWHLRFSILEIETDDLLFVAEIQFFSSLTTIIPELDTQLTTIFKHGKRTKSFHDPKISPKNFTSEKGVYPILGNHHVAVFVYA